MNTTLAEIDPAVEEQAATVLAEMGLTIADAVRLMLIQTARDKALPFKPSLPNAATIAAMEDADAGRVTRAADIDDLFLQLNAGT